MKIITNLDQIPEIQGPIALTIGVYDGVHLGHQQIFKELHKYTRKGGTRVILTFSDHPSSLLHPDHPVPLLTTLEHRLHLLESYGFDLAIVLPFNQNLSNLPYDVFIHTLYDKLPFNHLVLGTDARLGKNQEGSPKAIQELSKKLNFDVKYLTKETYHKEPISSGRIRKFLNQGNLKKVKKMLGRPYSIYTPFVQPIQENEEQYRLDLQFENLCLLPSAVYAVDIETFPAIAFLRGSQDVTGHTQLSLSVTFEHQIAPTSHLNLKFVSYLYNELDPDLRQPISLLKTLNPQLNPL